MAEVTVPPLGLAVVGLGAASPYHPPPHPRALRLRRDRKDFQFNFKSTLLNSINKPGLFWLFSSLTHVSLSVILASLFHCVCHPSPPPSRAPPTSTSTSQEPGLQGAGHPSSSHFLLPLQLSPLWSSYPLPPFPQPGLSSLSLFLQSSSSQSSNNPLLHRPSCP